MSEWRYEIGTKTQFAHLYHGEDMPLCGGGCARQWTRPLSQASASRKYPVRYCASCSEIESRKPPPALDAIAEKVLGYRPKAAKVKLRKKARRPAKRKAKPAREPSGG